MANLSNINGKFVVEQTTGNVGIGTTDPDYLLHVNSSDITNGTRLIIENTNGSGKKYGLIADNTGIFAVRDVTAGADRFSISNLGNSTFAGQVQVNKAKSGTGVENYDLIRLNLSGTGAVGDSSTIGWFSTSGTKTAGIEGISGLDNILYGELAFHVRRYTTDTYDRVMTINNRGNVGIGTDSPNFKLHVSGTGGSDTLLRLENTTVNKYPNLRFTAAGAEYDIGVGGTGTATGYVHNFYIYDITNSASRITLTQAGNVGIGYTDPAGKLSVSSNVTIGTNTVRERLTVGGKVYIEETGVDWNETTPGQAIGTQHFDPVGSGADNTGNAITFGASDAHAGATAQAGIYTRSDGTYGTKMYFATTDSYAVGSKTRMMIDYTGNVGIGTESPNQEGFGVGNRALSVKAPTSGGVANLELIGLGNANDDELGYVNFMSQAATNAAAAIVGLRHTSDTSGKLSFRTAGSERMRITSAGGISFGSTGTAYGTSGQVLTSNGNAAPTWQAAGGGTVTWPNVGAGVRTNYTLGIKPPANGYAGFYFTTSTGTGEDAGYFLIRGTSDAGQVYKAEGITLVADAGWLSLVSRTTSTTGVRILSGASSAERLVIKDDGLSYFVGNLGIGNSSTGFSSDYDNLIVGSGSGDNGIIIYSGTTNNSTLAFAAENVPSADFKIRVEHDYPFGQMEVYFEHNFNNYLRMFQRTSGQDPMIKVGHNSIPSGSNSGDDAIMQFRPDGNNWYPAIAINAEDSTGSQRGFIEMKSNRSSSFAASYFLKFFNYNSNEIGSIRVSNNNNNVAYNTSSDYRLKEDLKEFKALDTVCKIKVYNYTWKDDPSDFRDQGILAHELDELIPQAVSGEKDALDKDDNILPQSIDYSKIVPHLVQSIQELKAEIEILKNK